MTATEERTGARAPTHHAVRAVALAWAVSRAVAAAGLLVGAGRRAGAGRWDGFVVWDGVWYRRIADVGFGGAPVPGVESPWPFFPLLPGALRLLGALGLPAAAAVVVLNHALLLVALVGLWRLVERRSGPDGARSAVWVLALFPMSAVFSMLYPSAAFLAASVWAFELAERRRWAWAGAAAAVSTMARPNGAVVVAVLTLAVFASGGSARWRRAIAVVAPSVALFGAWLAVCAARTGDPFVFVRAKGAWREHLIVEAVRVLVAERELGQVTVHVGLATASALALVVAWRRLPASWRVLALITLVLPMITGVVGWGRYTNACFPLMAAGGIALADASPLVRRAVLAMSAVGVFVAAASMARYRLLP